MLTSCSFFSEKGNALYLGGEKKKSRALSGFPAFCVCLVMLLSTGRCWSGLPGSSVHLGCFSEVMSRSPSEADMVCGHLRTCENQLVNIFRGFP